MKKTICTISGLMMLAIASHAQTNDVSVSFETNDYKNIGVYDTWEHSPFRSQQGATPQLAGNVNVVDNIDTAYDEVLKTKPDSTLKVLGFQRSRFGSNTFGARIDLNKTFELTTTTKYVHVMIHKPVAGRVMLVGLGKRKDRPGQSTETEQFWALSSNEVTPDKWVDAVFPVKGAGGIDIYSLVVIPDCEDPGRLKEDFIAYIDQIEVNDERQSTTNRDDYPMNYEKSQKYTRTDRGLKGISMGNQSFTVYDDITTSTPIYTHLAKKEMIAKAGETVNVAVDYKGTWMNGYVYIDYNNDGRFTPVVSGGKPVANSGNELCTYSFLASSETNDKTGFNSAGKTIANGARDTRTMPSFTLPDSLKTGYYRMRYKVDWNCADPGGNVTDDNNILQNGGGVIDIRLNIHGDSVLINHSALNGDVFTEDGKQLSNTKAAFGQPFAIKVVPAPGFQFTGVKVRHGYNLNGDSLSHGTYQYIDEFIPRDSFNTENIGTIPASMMDGDVTLEGVFVDEKYTLTYELYFGDEQITTKTVYGAQTGEVSVPDEMKRDFCGYALDKNTVTTLPANVRINATWTGPVQLTTAGDSVWYQLKVSSKDRWIAYKKGTPNVKFVSAVDNTNGLWAFCGNPYEGFTIINRATPGKVLASASPKNDSNTGANTHATLVNTPVSSNKTSLWTLTASTYGDGKGFYINNPEGYALNYRSDSNLAYWTQGRDGGSTFIPTLAIATGISNVTVSGRQGQRYNLQGQPVSKSYKGIVLQNGRKYIQK